MGENAYLDSFGPNTDTLAAYEKNKYTKIFEDSTYRRDNQGLQLWIEHRDIFPENPLSAVDLGCGNGALFTQWINEGIDGYGIDHIDNGLTADHPYKSRRGVACLWDRLAVLTQVMSIKAEDSQRFELGVCADVMEHIPPAKVDDALKCICPLSDVTIFQIANYPSVFGDLHLTLQDAYWWQRKLEQHGTVERLNVSRAGVEEYVFRFVPYE